MHKTINQNIMKHLILALGLAIGLSGIAHAQFYSSETVYCYEYDYTSNDGIKSKKSNQRYYFVNFQNNMMGFTRDTPTNVRKNLMSSISYYDDKARNDLATRYSDWKSNPNSHQSSVFLPTKKSIYQYNDSYSTSYKYTYTLKSKYIQNHSGFGYDYNTWGPESWKDECYTFSIDRSEMIIWKTDDSNNRDYYKKVDVSDIRPNTDFLY